MVKTTGTICDLVTTSFQKSLLEDCFDNLKDKNNRLRFNNFAYSIRELSRHFLDTLAPERDVVLCLWFLDESRKGMVTRRQKIKYAITGGLSDSEIDEKSTLVIKAFENFANRIIECRESIIEKLESKISREIVEKAMWEISDKIDILATHHNIEEINIRNYNVLCISSNKILIKVLGDLEVRLQWGSDKDLSYGDGCELYEDFPFSSVLSFTINEDLEKTKIMVEDYEVYTDKWYK